MKKVTVIVPVYNAEENIRKCIKSIINQTYKNFELLIINDGSTDHSLDIIHYYEKQHKNIRVIDKKNEGVAKTRNLGIEKAHGEYIMFVDNDDYLDENYLKEHIQTIINSDFDIVISGYRRINSELKILHTEKLKDTYWSKFIIMAPWAKIYKKSFLINNNVQFLNYGIGEDVYFNLVVYSYMPKIKIIDYVGYNWFLNTKSVSNTSQKGLNNNIDILVLLDKILAHYTTLDKYTSYYLTRYYIWYLLFSGRKSSSQKFINEYKRINKWYVNKNISLTVFPFSYKLNGESFDKRFTVFIFVLLQKLHLLKLFAKIYCKGEK